MRRQGAYDADCIPSFSDLANASTEDRAALLRPLVARVRRASRRYDAALPDAHTLTAMRCTTEERKGLIDGYEGRTAAMKRALAAMCETLPDENADLCPYCSLDQNPDLDHVLPKAAFPEFALYAPNLVPICTVCNRKKLNVVRSAAGDRVLLNPAFEPSIDEPIVEAQVAYPDGQVVVTYRLDDHGQLPVGERGVARRHFVRLGLAGRYRKRAHGYLAALKTNLRSRSDGVREAALRNKLEGAALSAPANGWEPALFRAIEDDVPAMLVWLAPP